MYLINNSIKYIITLYNIILVLYCSYINILYYYFYFLYFYIILYSYLFLNMKYLRISASISFCINADHHATYIPV